MANFPIQRRVSVQKHNFNWRLVPVDRATCKVHWQPDLCRLGREDVGLAVSIAYYGRKYEPGLGWYIHH